MEKSLMKLLDYRLHVPHMQFQLYHGLLVDIVANDKALGVDADALSPLAPKQLSRG